MPNHTLSTTEMVLFSHSANAMFPDIGELTIELSIIAAEPHKTLPICECLKKGAVLHSPCFPFSLEIPAFTICCLLETFSEQTEITRTLPTKIPLRRWVSQAGFKPLPTLPLLES